MKVGDRISIHRVNGTIIDVHGESACVVAMDDGTTWFSPEHYNPSIVVPFPQIEEVLPYISEPIPLEESEESKDINEPELVPAEIPVAFLDHLTQNRENIKIRMGFPPKSESGVRTLFENLGLKMPDDIRPFNVGARGSIREGKRGLGLEISFPSPEDRSIIPLRFKELQSGELQICNTRFGLGLLKLGFSVNSYAHKTVGRDLTNK